MDQGVHVFNDYRTYGLTYRKIENYRIRNYVDY